jgi:TonB-dependent receptor
MYQNGRQDLAFSGKSKLHKYNMFNRFYQADFGGVMRQFILLTLVTVFTIFALRGATAAVISGTIMEDGTNAPLPGAHVVLEGTNLGAAADLDGYFTIYGVPNGVYTIHASMVGYDDEVISGVAVQDASSITLGISLKQSTIQLEDAEIRIKSQKGTEERELQERLEIAAITDALDGETIKSMPDPDVAHVVRRTTGVSTVGGDPLIRGLGLRYSKVTLNRSHVAGTEPNRSGVSLELFPSSLMQQVTINKSFLPDQFGEFGGGVVDMSTWEFPGQAEFNFSASGGYRPGTTAKNFLSYDGGSLDFLGFDDGSRSLPGAVEAADRKITLAPPGSQYGYPLEDIIEFSRAFDNNWNFKETTALPNQSYSASYANSTKLFNRQLGFIFSGLYKNSFDYQEEERTYTKASQGEVRRWHVYNFETYTTSIILGGLAAFRYDASPYSTLNMNILANHDTDNETRYYYGWNDDHMKNKLDWRFRFLEQVTLTGQISGKHIFPSLKQSVLNWQTTVSRGIRNEPDTREIQYEADPGETMVWAQENQSGSRIYGFMYDNSLNTSFDWTLPLSESQAKPKLKFGASFLSRHRDSELRTFQFDRVGSEVDLSQDPESLFNPDNMGLHGFLIRESTQPTDSYEADHDLYAAYMMLDVQVIPKLRFTGGLRLEHSVTEVLTYELFTATTTPIIGTIETDDFLPAANLVYALTNRSNLRLAGSQTVSRPDFREMSPHRFTDVIGGPPEIGNPDLKRAKISHADIRYEIVHGTSNLLAVSVFYKYFKNPIEEILKNEAQIPISYENAESADNYGVEIEIRQHLGDITPILAPWSVSTNLTLLESDINLSDTTRGIQTSKRRPLHGQSPYLFNFNIQYRHPEWKTQANAYYHVFGKRISDVGFEPLPDIYELPHPDLDIAIRQPITPRFTVKASAENLLNSEIKFKQGDIYTRKYKKGITISVGFSYHN